MMWFIWAGDIFCKDLCFSICVTVFVCGLCPTVCCS